MNIAQLVDFICAAPLIAFAVVSSLLTLPWFRALAGKNSLPEDIKKERPVVWGIMIVAGGCGFRLLTHAMGLV